MGLGLGLIKVKVKVRVKARVRVNRLHMTATTPLQYTTSHHLTLHTTSHHANPNPNWSQVKLNQPSP